jgi:pimeloyl-ACP methyl ester carboxylesterase
MMHLHFKWLACALSALAFLAPVRALQAPTNDAAVTFTVFLRQRPVGQETVQRVVTTPTGTLIRGSNRLGPPLDVVTRTAEIHYSPEWHPTRLVIEGTSRGEDVAIRTTFANGQASSEITVNGKTEAKTDAVAADTFVLPNGFLGSYSAVTRRLVGAKTGTTFRAYIAPQGEVPLRLDGIFSERIETPRESLTATRYALVASNPPPGGDMHISVWADGNGDLLRLSMPAQALEVAREDIASAAARTTAFSIPGDESVNIPATGFNLAASVSKPANATGSLPAIVLVGGVSAADRDGVVNGVPVIGQLAATLVESGFLVVRYDRRGVGQSGGRAETATLNDYAEDVRAVLTWLEKRRKDVDEERIALVGHGDGAWIALRVADRDDRVGAVALLEAGSVTGAELVLEQQRELLTRSNASPADQQAKIELQQRINAATLKGSGWEGIPDTLRSAAETPWFQSYLAFDPGRVLRDVHQPLLIVRASGASGIGAHHAERLAEIARARKRKVAVEVVDDVKAIGGWLAKNLE